jgi:hypothetical protein
VGGVGTKTIGLEFLVETRQLEAKVSETGLMKTCNKVGQCVDRKAVELFFMAASGMMFGVRAEIVCFSTVELDGEMILTRFVPDALFLDGVSFGMIDA